MKEAPFPPPSWTFYKGRTCAKEHFSRNFKPHRFQIWIKTGFLHRLTKGQKLSCTRGFLKLEKSDFFSLQEGKAHLPWQIQAGRRGRLFRQVTSKYQAAEHGAAKREGTMCPGKLGKMPQQPSWCGSGAMPCTAAQGVRTRASAGCSWARGSARQRGCAGGHRWDRTKPPPWTSAWSLRWGNIPSHHVRPFGTFPPKLSSARRKKLQILVVCV